MNAPGSQFVMTPKSGGNDKHISGVNPDVATDLGDFDQLGGKQTLQLTDKDQFIGYSEV